MSSRRRALERKLVKSMVPVASNADPTHGCEECRSIERRRGLVAMLINSGGTETCAQCPVCGAFWLLELFLVGQEVHARFAPNHTHDHSKHGAN